MRRAFAYLLKERGLEKDIVSFFEKENLIYENCEKSEDRTKEYHNAVFVGFDENGTPKHANKLYVFEGPIDMLSFITMYKDSDWQKHSYVALCGLSLQAVLKQLELNSNLGHVVICMDNDEAGNKACHKFEKLLQEKDLSVSRFAPKLKDFNEDLKVKKGFIKDTREDKLPEVVLRNDKESDLPEKQENQDFEQIRVSQTVVYEEKLKSNEKGDKNMAEKKENTTEQVQQKKEKEVDEPSMHFYVKPIDKAKPKERFEGTVKKVKTQPDTKTDEHSKDNDNGVWA